MEIKVVTGSSYGDEGKGLTSGCLAREAIEENKKVLTVFFNGGSQRGHSFSGQVLHCIGAGDLLGGDTFYHERFLLDPVTLWLTGERVIIDPMCRVILPCDVMRNRAKEVARGAAKHGSCGMGIFECVKRSANENGRDAVYAYELMEPFALYQRVKKLCKDYVFEPDDLYNMDNWMRAVAYVTSNCKIQELSQTIGNYDTVIFEGGQGLLLDQSLIKYTHHLTPSSVGSYNIARFINSMNCKKDIYYVSRTYMTRHGAGEMEAECKREDINPLIIDKTNQPNPWQDALRFGYLNQETLAKRIKKDFSVYTGADAHIVYTQLNYTNNQIATKNGLEQICKPDFITSVIGSNKEDSMFTLEL